MSVDPGDWLGIAIASWDSKVRLYKREADGEMTTLATASTAVTLTPTNWYTANVVIDDDPGNSALQRLRLLGGMGLRPVNSWPLDRRDADPTRFGNDSAKITSTAVDDVWSAGYAGLFMGSISSAQEFDDLKEVGCVRRRTRHQSSDRNWCV